MDDWTITERKIIDPNVGTDATLHAAFAYILANGGGTFNDVLQPVTFNDGFSIAWRAHEEVKPLNENVLMDFWLTKAGVLSEAGNYLGAWEDGEQLYLDVSVHLGDQIEAVRMGKREQQLAIWDWAKNGELWLAYFDEEGNLIDEDSDPYVKPAERGALVASISNPNGSLTLGRFRPNGAWHRWHVGDHVRVPASELVRGDTVGEIVTIMHQKGKVRYRVAFDDGTSTIAEPEQLTRAFLASSDGWHTVPAFDHRDKAKHKPGDTIDTVHGPANVINTAQTPLGSLYRVTLIPSGQTIDLMETETFGKTEGHVFATSQREDDD